MDRWKSRGGKSQRKEEKKKENQRRQRVRRKKIKTRGKVGNSRSTVFCQWLVAPEGGKVGKAAGADPSGAMTRRCGAKHISEVKMCRTHQVRSIFGSWVEMSKKCTPLWREAHFQVSVKNTTCSDHFWRFRCGFAWQAQGILHLAKTEQNMKVCSISNNDSRRGTFKEDLDGCISRGRRNARDMFTRAVRRSRCWFPERGCILEHEIFRFAKMILRDGCNTSYDLASLFRCRRGTLKRWNGKIAKRIGMRPSALFSTFDVWRKTEVSQNCFVFDVVKFNNWGNHTELLRFWCCQVQKPRKCRRIASFSNLQIDR